MNACEDDCQKAKDEIKTDSKKGACEKDCCGAVDICVEDDKASCEDDCCKKDEHNNTGKGSADTCEKGCCGAVDICVEDSEASCEDDCCKKDEQIRQQDDKTSCEDDCCQEDKNDCCQKDEHVTTTDSADAEYLNRVYPTGTQRKNASATGGKGCCGSLEDDPAPGEDDCCEKDQNENVDACGNGCCSSPLEMDEGTQGTDEKVGEGNGDEDDDDSLCPCCIEILVKHPDVIGRTRIEAESADPTLFAKNSAHRLSAAIRKCCRLFEASCAQKACCFSRALPSKKGRAVSVSVPSKCKQPAQPIPADYASDNLTHSSPDESTGEPLKLEITGMDCADCCIKVSRALSRLPSIKRVHLAYIEAVASLLYNPEVITPEAIARYVARATGFTIQPIGKEDTLPSTHITLPITFSQPPPPDTLAQLDPRHRSELRGFTEILFPIRGDGARQPRQVLADLAEYGPALVPSDALGKMDDRVSKDLRRIALRTLCSILLAIPVLILAWAPLPGSSFAHGLASVILTTLIQFVAFPILSSSVRFIVFMHAVDMSVLVSVSSLSAWIFSLVSFAFEVAGKPFADPFFETVALLVALVHIGRLVQAATRRTTSSAIRELQQLQPADVSLVEQVGESSVEIVIDARLLYYGDIVRVGPATRIPTDGMVVAGSSAVDESFVTGESLPSAKQVGSSVTAGTLNLEGELDIQVTQLIHENYLVRIARLVRQAQATRSRFQDLADRFSAVILPVSAACSAIAFVVWFLVNRYGRHLSSVPSAVSGLTYALAILIVSCPCAIGVAVPLIVAAALRAGRREGVLFRSSEALQKANDVDVVVFDKTGTLSRGLFSLERKELLAPGVDKIIYPLISTNQHPISKAVLAHVAADVSRPPDSSAQSQGIISLPGMGVKSTLAGYPLLGGNPKFTGAAQHPFVQEFTARGLTLFTVTLAGELVAAFGLADMPRTDAPALLEALAVRGKRVFVLSGDNAGAVARFAAMLPIEPGDARAACTPADKAEFVKALQARGQRVCFVGDGTNDAPALAQADVALCITSGADVAVAAAGALVAGESMKRGVLAALDVARHAQQQMVVALGWCILYNAAALLFAGGVFVRVRIEPQWAGLGELVSLVPVLIIGLALDLRWRWRRQ
ncbi:E1-E2 ATPase-domain-containing protein [Mycena metata]|uniref:E1-E2 ATPase-domain-containing protein n=1 Tax=Mycena metata TaxID=1033252 RepID=A0AAD7I6Q8_9AGAR|nr:E1-E2 ATPase-domain-containing protein [Mycena metata]